MTFCETVIFLVDIISGAMLLNAGLGTATFERRGRLNSGWGVLGRKDGVFM